MRAVAVLIVGGLLVGSANAGDRPFSLADDPPSVLSPRPRFGGEGQGEGASVPSDLPSSRRTQWWMFTAEWCPACQAARGDFQPWLARSGWQIDDSTQAHIRLIDGDRHADLVAEMQIAAYPTFVLMRDGRELFRQQDYPGRMELVRRYAAAVENHAEEKAGDLRSGGVARSGDRPQQEPGDRPQPESPQHAISIGTLTGQRENIAELIAVMRPLLGDGGTLTMKLDRHGDPTVLLPLGERLSLRTGNPLIVQYSLRGDVLTCRFAEPLPRGRFTFGVPVEQPISAVTLSVSEVVFELPRSPDVRFAVEN